MEFLALLRNRINSTVMIVVLTIQVTNLSIDAVDPSPHAEDLTVNEIESYLELIVEVMLDHEDAIQETDDHDHSTHKPGGSVVLFLAVSAPLSMKIGFEIVGESKTSACSLQFQSVARSVTAPPPRFV
jgi:hypothetical protein